MIFLSMVKLFSYHGEYFFLPWKTFFFPWRIFFLTMEDFFLSMEKIFSFHGRFFLSMEDFFLTMEYFFLPWGIFFTNTILLTPIKWVIIGRPPRGQREQGRLVEGEVAREASQRARHHATEARAGGGMRDWARGKTASATAVFPECLRPHIGNQ